MSLADLRVAVLEDPRLQSCLREVAARFVVGDLPSVTRTPETLDIDWSFALMCASVLTSSEKESEQAAALRIAQGALVSSETDQQQRDAAAVLLDRMGNRPALALAENRACIAHDAWHEVPVPLRLDVMRRRMEFSIQLADGTSVAGNRFQRRFWSLASAANWISVSAPTSAGKSFIVMAWLRERVARSSTFRGVYVVPTRALIDEVSRALRDLLGETAAVHSIPWDPKIGSAAHELHVLTQERLHLLLQRFPNFAPDVVFIDEAQKFGDNSRGVLLQRALGDALDRNPSAQVMFASPLTSNPELLLQGAPPQAQAVAVAVEEVTVNQTLLWADQEYGRPKDWQLIALQDGEPSEVGTFSLIASPSPASQRLPLVAVALGGYGSGNVVYVNRPSDAEKAALQIAEALGADADISDHPDVAKLRELVEKTVHRRYALSEVLARGVAFHYGNIPLLVRGEIERLFRENTLRYLVCTSTLLEGVNLPCRNLFARGPKKGNGNVMTAADFWNLAGRAGRWGTEFQGNIVCVDATKPKVWPDAPRVRQRQPLRRATDDVLTDLGALRAYIAAGAPATRVRDDELLETVFSYVSLLVVRGQGLGHLPGLEHADPTQLAALESEVAAAMAATEIPLALLERHAGVSAIAMQRLLDYFHSAALTAQELLVAPPESPESATTYQLALARSAQFLGGPFGEEKRQWQLAYLIRDWMRGFPLALLIDFRIKLDAQRGGKKTLPALIRETMQDVEQYARFHAPKFLACYQDVLEMYLSSRDEAALMTDRPDLSMMLELGVSRRTQVTLMALGLSRSTVVAVSEFVVGDDLSREDCIEWLHTHDLEALDAPALVRAELETVRDRYPRPAGQS